jgi:hypothetical protein
MVSKPREVAAVIIDAAAKSGGRVAAARRDR